MDFNETFRHLSAAPIAEAVIQWVARAGKPLARDELQQQLADRLRDYPESQPQQKLQFEAKIGPDGPSAHVQNDAWLGFRLTSSDQRYIAQFQRDGLIVSRLQPYENWEIFSAEAGRLWKIFVELAEPREVERLGVRFINRIDVTLSSARRYLSAPPKSLDRFGMPLKGFLFQSMHEVPWEPLQINVIQAIEPPAIASAGGCGLIVDIDVSTTQPLSLADDVLDDYLKKMHWLKNKAFFSLISKTAISRFEKGEK
ncbi:MAG: TIGR04255 family protein [Planctomycetia bacterium]|nr:TIGR04255 family protein [Planctomycetia bacterium]